MTGKSKRTKQQPAENDERPDAKGRRTESRDVDSLHPHPRQAEFFNDLSDHELAILAGDIRLRGIERPPEILPDGTVLRGHQRVRAAKSLGLTRIEVLVRYDLKDGDENAVLEVFLTDNLYRRHLSKLGQARCAIKLAEIDCDRRNKTSERQRNSAIVKAVSQRLGDSTKNAQRYISLSRAAESIQHAYERGLLPLVRAAATVWLRPCVQEKLAKTVAGLLKQIEPKGEEAIKKRIGEAVRATLDATKKRKRVAAPSPMAPLDEVKKALGVQLSDVQSNVDQITGYINDSDEIVKPTRVRTVFDVRGCFERGLELVGQIESAIEREPAIAERVDDEETEDEDVSDTVSTYLRE